MGLLLSTVCPSRLSLAALLPLLGFFLGLFPNRYTDPDGTSPQAVDPDLKLYQKAAGYNLENRAKYGYDPEGMLKDPHLSPKMVYEADAALTDFMRKYGDQYQAKITRGFDPGHEHPIYNLGLGFDVKLYDKEGRFITSDDRPDLYHKLAESAVDRGFRPHTYGNGYEDRLGFYYMPHDSAISYSLGYGNFTQEQKNVKLFVRSLLNKPHIKDMQDARKAIWKMAHGSYWRYRYGYYNAIKPK
jgi:hypothetical protein